MCEVRGIGVDLCEIARMEKLLREERFLRRWFSPEEQAYILSKKGGAAQTMAGIFAAKEAFVKALGIGIALPLDEVAVDHEASGRPCYRLSGKAAEALRGGAALLSVSHDGGMAVAFCTIVKSKTSRPGEREERES